MNSRLDVLSFGEALVDFFAEGADGGPAQGILLRDAERFSRHLGGAPANVAVGLARLGVQAGLMTLVGGDEFGAYVKTALEAEGVDTRGVGTHRIARNAITFVAVGPRGERSFSSYRHPSADQMIERHDIDARLIGEAAVFHYGSSTLAREPSRDSTRFAVTLARQAGCVISSDPNLRFHLWDDPSEAPVLVRQLLALTDLAKLSDDELAPIVGISDPVAGAQAIRALGPGLVVVTLGERGCYFDGASAGTGWVPGVRVEAVDTTGAGDGFVAGLLAELKGRRPGDLGADAVGAMCAFANRVAAKVVTSFGATEALPRRSDLS